MAVDADGGASSPESDLLHENRHRALTVLPFTAFGICVGLGLVCLFAGIFAFMASFDIAHLDIVSVEASDGGHSAFLLAGVGAAILALSLAVMGVAGLVWYFTPAWLETALAERLRRQHVAPRANALAIAWLGFVAAVVVAVVAAMMLIVPNAAIDIFMNASLLQFGAIEGAILFIATAPSIWCRIAALRRRHDSETPTPNR